VASEGRNSILSKKGKTMKILKTKEVWKSSLKPPTWLRIYQRFWEHRDGSIHSWFFASRKENSDDLDSVIIIPIIRKENDQENDRFVLIKEFRVTVGDYCWSFPAGIVDPNEPFMEAAKRELHEETGYEITNVREASNKIHSIGLSDDVIRVVIADVKKNGKQHLEDTEDISVKEIDREGATALLSSGDRIATKAWFFLHMFAKWGVLP